MTHPTPSTAAPAPTGAVPPQEAVVFDMDGVVTDTATLHATAWRQLFEAVLPDPRAGGPHDPFDAVRDYRRYVDGRSREDGVADFLAARGIHLPLGRVEDQAGAWTVHGLAARKNELYLDLLAERGARTFPGTVDLLDRLRAGGVPVALVTASRNADALLAATGLQGLFDVVVDGERAAELGLAGKPDPAMFLQAVRELGVAPARAAVVEDAVAGVQAARRGGFGLVVGVARAGQRAELEAAGAHVVVEDVGQLDLGALRADPWTLVYEGFDPAHEGHREALTTLGNGYLGTRGAAPERAADGVHYPGTYLAGVYNRLVSSVHGRQMEDEHLVNAPDWLPLDVRIDAGAWWSAGGLTTPRERRELDLRRGVLTRTAVLTDAAGRRLRLTQRRMVSMARPHLAALETTLVAQGWDGTVQVRSGIDAEVVNANVAEYAALASRHLRTTGAEENRSGTLVVEVETTQSQMRIATATRTSVGGSAPVGAAEQDGELFTHVLTVRLTDGSPVVIDKTAAIFTSRDRAIASPTLAALDALTTVPGGFDDLLPQHEEAWARLWKRFRIELDADTQTRLVINLHVFHLLQSLSAHTAELDAGVPARGLHGEGYRGHVFWDELFVLPVLTAHLPQVSRGLLDYRWRRLDAARRAAAAAGLIGAMFPWQSGSDGREETPVELFNTRSGRWMPDNSRRQRHVSLAVAVNAWGVLPGHRRRHLARRAGRRPHHRGRPLLHRPRQPRRRHRPIPHQRGDGPGRVPRRLPRHPRAGPRRQRLYQRHGRVGVPAGGRRTRRRRRPRVRRRPRPPRRPLGGAGRLGAREPAPGRTVPARRHQRAVRRLSGPGRAGLGPLPAHVRQHRAPRPHPRGGRGLDQPVQARQAGRRPHARLPPRAGPAARHARPARLPHHPAGANPHCGLLPRPHGARVHPQPGRARLRTRPHGPGRGWATFREALAADLDDTQGGTTQEGIHLGAMAGTLDIITRAFAGCRTDGECVHLDPLLPRGLGAAGFQVQHRGQRLLVDLDPDGARVAADPCAANSTVSVRVAQSSATLVGGQSRLFQYGGGRDRPHEEPQPPGS